MTSRHRRDWFFDISLQAVPEDDGVTVADFNRVVNMKTLPTRLRPDLRVVTSIVGKYDSCRCLVHIGPYQHFYNFRTINQQHNRPLGRNRKTTKFPTVKSDQGCRIYVYSESKRPFLMDLFLKTEWILNVFGAAGIVMIVTLINRKRTKNLIIQKQFKSIRSTGSAETSSEENCVNDQSVESLEACSDDPEALQVWHHKKC